MVIGIARMKNHPNVLAIGVLREGEKTERHYRNGDYPHQVGVVAIEEP